MGFRIDRNAHWDTGDWIFAVEAVDNLGASWDIEFTGTECTGIYWAQD